MDSGVLKGGLPVKLAQPARRALAGAGIQNLEQLSQFSEAEIRQLHGIGPNALEQFRRALAEQGLSFRDETPNPSMVQLIPMADSDYPAYLQNAIREYAQDKVESGNWLPDEALQRSEQEFLKLLPAGVQTENHYLYTILDEAGGQKVGMIWFVLDCTHPLKLAFIFDFEIYEAFRRRGYGLQALRAAEAQARQMGAKKIGLHVFAHNHAARALYEKAGYQVTNLNMSKPLT